MSQFKINDFLSLKLEEGKSMLYVKDKKFRQCRFLLLIIPKDSNREYTIDSIDEASEYLSPKLEKDIKPKDVGLSSEQVFWGHCSNIQAWAENNYDTRVLHSNLAFPLLKELTEAGDPKAKRVFKDEIAKRFLSGYIPVAIYLMNEGYLDYLNDEEFDSIIEEFQRKLNYTENLNEKYNIANAWNNMSLVLCKKGNYRRAITVSKQAIQLKQNYVKAWNNLGYILIEKGDYQEAIKPLTRALELDSNYFIAWSNLALSYLELGYYENAIVAAKNAIELEPNFANPKCHLGYAYYNTGEPEKGIKLIKEGLKIKPNYERGNVYLKKIMSKMNQFF